MDRLSIDQLFIKTYLWSSFFNGSLMIIS